MLNVGIIGLGAWGRHLVESVQDKSDRIRFVAAATGTPAKAQTFAAEHKLDLKPDVAALLSDRDVAAIVSSGPAGLHAAHSLAGLNAGKHVLAVKPMGVKRADAEALRAAAAKSGKLLALGYNRCFYPAVDELRRRIRDGDLGTLLHAEGNFCVDRYFKLKAGDWKTDRSQVLAGALADHMLYAMIELFGRIAEVDAHGSTRALDIPITETTAVLLRFKTGASGLLTAMGATATYERLTVFGSKGWAEVRGGSRFTYQPVTGKGTDIDFSNADAERIELESFADAVAGVRPFPVPVDDAVHSVAALEAINRSAATGKPVTLDA